ncbi:carbon-nitrogen hydrolase family protein [Pusillimonas sp. CC-YST705]|uniref:Carbon-nitrogen hydrolase family protein n=1 Tax=Mesopusillimonas faecipullorum TaxID=2755040 RepID=A0ABS8C9Z6_9BURK|nr:carbon-nitrogen hydrolase family protein [Mesopusillimonas faecipullorum]MCB5362860.1 carbon-nitrogen hydrolase family protein [Mesopusillimonas faecipullorum]
MQGALQIAERLRVAAVQMVSTPRLEDNLEQAAQGIAQAVQEDAHLVVLPEYFCLMGHADTDKLALREAVGQGPIQDFLRAQARQHGIWLVGGTLPLDSGQADRIYNTSLVYGPDGSQLARYDKIHLFGFSGATEAYDESRTIRAGSAPQSFDAPCGRVGLSICYDLRFPELYRAFVPATLMVVPSAFTYTTGAAHWEVLLRARAIENQCYILAAAQGGRHENGRRTWGHSMLIDPWGVIVDCLPEGPGIVVGDIERERLAEVRAALPALQHRVL